MLSSDFTRWVVYANILAWPVAYYFMTKWLQGFAYRTDLTIWLFFAAGFSAFLIALLTVSFQAVKAALANPVKSLRYE
jgi:putative ABC transport system permease protein